MTGPVEFRVLGPTQARRDGSPVQLGGARRRTLVARLLLDAGQVVSTDTLLADAWEGTTNPPAKATLHSHINQLRSAIGACLQTRPGGYALCLDETTILDAPEFELQTSTAASQLASGDYASALGSLTEALARWHGSALQDVAHLPWAAPEAARLEELRAQGTEQLLRARLDAGQHDRAAADAEAAVAEQPLREQRWAIMILALYRCGRQADALAACRRLRTYLADQLGIDPSPPLTELEAGILRQDRTLDPPGRTPGTGAALADSPLSQGRSAARGREWRNSCELLTAADRSTRLGTDDLELLGDVAFMAGEQNRSISARRRAHFRWLDAGRLDRAAITAFLIVGNHYVRNRAAIAAGWYHKGRRLLRDQPEGAAHGVLAFTGALVAMANGQPEAAATAATEAQRIGRDFADQDIEVVGLTLRGCALTRLGRFDVAMPMLDEALATASTGCLGPVTTGQIFCWSTQALLAAADYLRAAEWIEAIEACGIKGIPGDCQIHKAEVLRALGQPDQAETEVLAARSQIQAIDLLHAGIAHYELAMIYLARSELSRAERALGHAEACGAVVQPGLAMLRLARGDERAAADMIDSALADAAMDLLRRANLLPAAIQIATATGDDTQAAQRTAELQQASADLLAPRN
ncbi:BTAD domain-containing putative transcriptional regulator [Amycolatopsis sp. NPDC059090]|uniref:AfsR/SARP family transcriptional regulator n=1 Tax=Amycolatopsis sp. NPDC059090 TaxID=3346723 RepID=UPI00366E0487